MRSLHQNAGSQPIRNEFGDPRAASVPPAGKAAWGPRYGWGTARLSNQTDGPPGQGITGYVRLTVPSSQGRGGRGFGHLGNPDLVSNQVSGHPVLPGQKITGSVFIRVQTAGVCQMAHAGAFYDASGARISTFTFAAVIMTSGVWSRISGTVTAPANASYMATYTVSAGASTGNWEAGDTLDGTGGMIVVGTYDGLFCDGLTPGWRYDSGSNGPSAGYPYTLPSLVGNPHGKIEGISASNTNLELAASDPSLGRTLYTVWDVKSIPATGIARGASAWSPTTGSMALRIDSDGTGRRGTFGRVQYGGGGDTVFTPTTLDGILGRKVGTVVLTALNGGAQQVRSQHLLDSDRVANIVGRGDGTMTNTLQLSSSGSDVDLLATYAFVGEHSRATRESVTRWLAARYEIPLPS